MPVKPIIKINPKFMYFGTTKGSLDLAIPFPSSGPFETSRAVDSARNALGEVVGQMVGRSVDKQSMTFNVLPCSKWWEMNRWIEANGMFFWCHYFSHNYGTWKDRRFYCGNPSCEPYMVNADTGEPAFYRNCKLNVIDMGESEESEE